MPGKRYRSIRPGGRRMYESLTHNSRFRRRYPKTYKSHAARISNAWAAYKKGHRKRV